VRRNKKTSKEDGVELEIVNLKMKNNIIKFEIIIVCNDKGNEKLFM
jgi:hypothetical protein